MNNSEKFAERMGPPLGVLFDRVATTRQKLWLARLSNPRERFNYKMRVTRTIRRESEVEEARPC